MKFSEIIEHAKALLQRQGRLTYRSLKREFDLEDEALEDLKFELIEGQELAVDKDGKVLVWVGERQEQGEGSKEHETKMQKRKKAKLHNRLLLLALCSLVHEPTVNVAS
jgi:hypothetical protein